jgi:hypothetical protein
MEHELALPSPPPKKASRAAALAASGAEAPPPRPGAELRAAVARAVAPLAFGNTRRAARKLRGFARAEQGSMLDLRLAAARSPSAARRALYLRHALDEARHARMLARRAAEVEAGREPSGLSLDREPPDSPDDGERAGPEAPSSGSAAREGDVRADSEGLFEGLGEVGFLAFVYVGEGRGRAQFAAYSAYFGGRGDERMRAMFAALVEDEARHEAYTWRLLVELCGGERAARASVRRALRWEAWRTWRRAGKAIAELAYGALMGALYLLLWPLAVLVRRRLPERRGWGPGEEA